MDLQGFEFLSLNGNPVVGATVQVWDATATHPPGGAILASTVTDQHGKWSFTGLSASPKDVKVTFTNEVRWYKGLAGAVLNKLRVETLDVATLTVSGTVTIGTLNVTTLNIAGQSLAANGSAAAPSYSYTNDPDSGAYRAAADQLGWSTGGTKRMLLDSSGLNLGNAGAAQTITTPGNELVLEETGDALGTARLRLQNRNGVNGAMFENANLDLVDFVFKAANATQRNIRFEARAAFTYFGSGTEFQIGDPSAVTLLASDLGVAVLRGQFRTTVNAGIGADPGALNRLYVSALLAHQYGMKLDHTWNNGALQYRGLSLNLTDTASLVTSLPIEVLLGGAEIFAVDKAGALRIGGSTVAVQKILQGSTTYNPPSLVDFGEAATTVTVTGAAVGDYVIAVDHSTMAVAAGAWSLTGRVSAANTVTVTILNMTGGTVDLASGTLKALVMKAA